jgi:pyruvate,orthophosphate dikinase
MQQDYPQAHADLVSSVQLLERHMADMQDCEFTVQEGERGGGGAQA